MRPAHRRSDIIRRGSSLAATDSATAPPTVIAPLAEPLTVKALRVGLVVSTWKKGSPPSSDGTNPPDFVQL